MEPRRAQLAPPGIEYRTAENRSGESRVREDRAGEDPADPAATVADELIAGQYADRPQLRPVLDTVLAALRSLGPVTVQARKTCVSLATPRRVFAVIQATTKTRVDLGLRLDDERPGGRLLAARDLGAATVRIALTIPEDVDADVLGWLRRAYMYNAAPPPPPPPPRRPAPVVGELSVVIEGFNLPGLTCPRDGAGEHHNVHIALYTKSKEHPTLVIPGRPWLATQPVPGDRPSARWEAFVTVRRDQDGFDFSGPYVRGDRADRHLGLAWGDVHADGTLRLIRGSKLKLLRVDPSVIEEAMRPGHRLVARIRLTGEPSLIWSAEPADAAPGYGEGCEAKLCASTQSRIRTASRNVTSRSATFRVLARPGESAQEA